MNRASSFICCTLLVGIAVFSGIATAGHGVWKTIEEAHQQIYKLELENFQLTRAILHCPREGIQVYLDPGHQFEMKCLVEREWINGNYFDRKKRK